MKITEAPIGVRMHYVDTTEDRELVSVEAVGDGEDGRRRIRQFRTVDGVEEFREWSIDHPAYFPPVYETKKEAMQACLDSLTSERDRANVEYGAVSKWKSVAQKALDAFRLRYDEVVREELQGGAS